MLHARNCCAPCSIISICLLPVSSPTSGHMLFGPLRQIGHVLCTAKKREPKELPWGTVCLSVTQLPLCSYYGKNSSLFQKSTILQNGSLRELFWLHFFFSVCTVITLNPTWCTCTDVTSTIEECSSSWNTKIYIIVKSSLNPQERSTEFHHWVDFISSTRKTGSASSYRYKRVLPIFSTIMNS